MYQLLIYCFSFWILFVRRVYDPDACVGVVDYPIRRLWVWCWSNFVGAVWVCRLSFILPGFNFIIGSGCCGKFNIGAFINFLSIGNWRLVLSFFCRDFSICFFWKIYLVFRNASKVALFCGCSFPRVDSITFIWCCVKFKYGVLEYYSHR